MKINKITMQNWKCFADKKVIEFDKDLTLLNWKNGEGKTSLIQAIILCLFDKRPDNLDYASLINMEKESKLILEFTHNLKSYVVERDLGKKTSYRLFKDGELLARTNKECKAELNKIIPESVMTSLWGYEPLSVSNVLNTTYLYEILDEEFDLPLQLKQHFTTNRGFAQKRKSTLESKIKNQDVTETEVKELEEEINDIESKIKKKAFVSDRDLIKAKKAEEDTKERAELQKEYDALPEAIYDRDTCKRIQHFGKSQEEMDKYFTDMEEELAEEKTKSSGSPLLKYPKSTISSMIEESNKECKCILCQNTDWIAPELDYDTIDNDKIEDLENKLKEKGKYTYKDLQTSIDKFRAKKKLEPFEYLDDYDYKSILDGYNEETNRLYDVYDKKKREYESLKQDFAQINELLEVTQEYNTNKECINIVDEYIAEAKDFYANKIVVEATKKFADINARYKEIFIENGIYKCKLFDKDYTEEKTLAVQALSKGEKTIVALALILAIRDIFMPDLPLIMDESFSNLDADNVSSIRRIIHEDQNQWIVVSHDERLV